MEDTKKTEELKTIDKLKQHRNKFEARWYVSNAFYDGSHFSWGKQDNEGQWIQTPTPKGKVLRQIPKAKKHINSIRNMILKVRMRPVVYPDKNVLYGLTDQGKIKEEEAKANKIADYVEYEMMERMKLMTFRKKLIKNAELMGHSFIQILTSGDELELSVYDAFDISVPFGINRITDDTPVVKHVAKRLGDIEKNKEYDQSAIKSIKAALQGKYSDSKFKEAMLQEKYGNAPEDLVLLDELYQIEDGKLVIRTYLGEEEIRTQNTNMTKIPISLFVWDDEVYQTSLMEDLIPLNRAYDTFISKLEHKVKKIDTGRIVMQAKEPAKILTTNDGEILRYKKIKPDVMEESQVSSAFFNVIGIIENDIKEQGVSMATGGDVPSGVKAWRAIESLKESDYASIGTQLSNFEECLTDLTEKLVDLIASNKTESEVVQIPKDNGRTETFKVIGAQGAEAMQNLSKDLIVIDPNMTVKVEQESQVGWTEVGKKDMVIELVSAGLLPAEAAINMLNVGNTKDIMKQMQMEASQGKSIIDMPDFKLLPKELQVAIVQYLSQGGVITDPNARPEDIEEVKKVTQES